MMSKENIQIEIVDTNATHVWIKFVSSGQTVKMNKSFFNNRVDLGFYKIQKSASSASVI